jgi:hypothetical protein
MLPKILDEKGRKRKNGCTVEFHPDMPVDVLKRLVVEARGDETGGVENFELRVGDTLLEKGHKLSDYDIKPGEHLHYLPSWQVYRWKAPDNNERRTRRNRKQRPTRKQSRS